MEIGQSMLDHEDLSEVLKHVEPEMLLQFEKTYKDVVVIPRKDYGLCVRCWATVPVGEEAAKQHKRWHKNVSLAIWMLQNRSLAQMEEQRALEAVVVVLLERTTHLGSGTPEEIEALTNWKEIREAGG